MSTLAGSGAEPASSPARSIVGRNAFALVRAVEQPSPKVQPPEKPLAAVKLTGVTSLFPQRLALFEITETGDKKVQQVIMAEGQRIGEIEVMSIDIGRGEVTVRNGPLVMNVTLGAAK